MQVKILRSVLVGDADVLPTRDGTVVDLDDNKAKEFIANGLAEEHKKAPKHENKMAHEPANKAEPTEAELQKLAADADDKPAKKHK